MTKPATNYQIFHNLDARYLRRGHVGDRYLAGYLAGFDQPSALYTGLDVCDDIFEQHNRDSRPDGQIRPSISVGDVIVLTRYYPRPNGKGAERTVTAFTVDKLGFREMPVPTNVLADYPDGYFDRTRAQSHADEDAAEKRRADYYGVEPRDIRQRMDEDEGLVVADDQTVETMMSRIRESRGS